ncbi:hypothetical protein V6N13_001657 [Hibiscus sabdariffa]|uniref:Reverse transcriptase zinc-binding domain-containing protein n=1 Tax=Hibiscus sabdariffa TaxID=183260 RepID=A0ABR2G8X7_9ROSI
MLSVCDVIWLLWVPALCVKVWDETVDHVLRECLLAKAIWRVVVQPGRLEEFLTLPYTTWLEDNLRVSFDFAREGENWKERFDVFCWILWKHKCSRIFDNSYVQRGDLRLCCEKLSAKFVAAFHHSNVTQVVRVNSVWKRPSIG